MENLHLSLLKKERNIYDLAELFHQNRFTINEILDEIANPFNPGEKLILEGNTLTNESRTARFQILDNVIDLRTSNIEGKDPWSNLNKRFMNYHKSLSVYTMMNSLPQINYLRQITGVADIQNATVIDVGAGTGHILCSFFKHPETLKYFNLDPNLRLLHDQFIRVYPDLLELKMGHLLCYAEELPIQNNKADLVMSMSSIDHFKDYKKFVKEAYRVNKVGGKIFICSHLDVPKSKRIQRVSVPSKLFSYSFWERLSRYLFYRKYNVGTDDHTFHFETIEPIESALVKTGYKILNKEEYYGNFWIVGQK
jgi:ubiquinone/menaquinone biosynthesis C-methylase UbiE